MKKRTMFFLALFPMWMYGQSIQWHCIPTQGDRSCNGYVTAFGKSVLVAKNYSIDMMQASSYTQYSKVLGAVVMGCGTGCSGNNFVDLASGKISNPYPTVVAVNSNKNVVATANLQGILLQSIFDPAKQIQLNFDFDQEIGIAAYMVRAANFNEDSSLSLTYIDAVGNKVSKTIPIDYQNLFPASASS